VPTLRFNPRNNTVDFVNIQSKYRERHTANVLLDGRTLIAAGNTQVFYGSNYYINGTNEVNLYDPLAVRGSLVGPLPGARASHAATLLPAGDVLITGGFDQYPFFDDDPPYIYGDAYLFDAKNDRFWRVGSLTTERSGHSATLLRDGRVLIAGGNVLSRTRFAEVYEPANPIPAASLYAQPDGSGAILHGGTARLVTPDDPAEPGEILELYGTGLADGGVIPPLVFIGGRAADVLYFGKGPGYDQINVRVPAAIAPGNVISVRMNYMDRPSNAVTLAIR
jgi:hypothetical protein